MYGVLVVGNEGRKEGTRVGRSFGAGVGDEGIGKG
jgi:hypothetical protein